MKSVEFHELKSYLEGLNGHLRPHELNAFLLGAFDPTLPKERGHLLREIAEILRQEVVKKETPCPLVQYVDKFVHIADDAFGTPDAHRTNDKNYLKEIVAAPFLQLFGSRCRVRIYDIDPKTPAYVGLAAYGMSEAYAKKFRGLTIPFENPPYATFPDTHYSVLTADSVTKIPQGQNADWYREHLGLGTLVDLTYTWHIGRNGELVTVDNLRDAAWALSFDHGCILPRTGQNDNHAGAPLVRIADKVLRYAYARKILETIQLFVKQPPPAPAPVAPAVIAVAALQAATQGVTAPEAAAVVALADAPRPQDQPTPILVQQDGSTSPFPDPDTFLSLAQTSKLSCIPAGLDHEAKPWVWAADDEEGNKVMDGYKDALEIPKPSALLICGDTGSGKGMLAKSINDYAKESEDEEFRRLMVCTLNPESWKETRNELTGVDDKGYTDVGASQSIAVQAGSGVVLVDEFLRIVTTPAGRAIEGQLRATIDSLIIGAPVVSQPKREREFKNKSLLIFTGSWKEWEQVGADEHLNHWVRRCTSGGTIVIPPWSEFSPATHGAFLRWCLVDVTQEKNGLEGAYEWDALMFLAKVGRATKTGPATIANAIKSSSVLRGRCVVVTFAKLRQQGDAKWKTYHQEFARSDRGSDLVLKIGLGSTFVESLTPLERLIAMTHTHALDKNVVKKIMTNQVAEACESLVNPMELLKAHYLLLAAVRHIRPNAYQDEDRYLTTPRRMTKYFESRRPYLAAFNRCYPGGEITPSSLHIKGDKNNREKGRTEFLPLVTKLSGDLQSMVERIACACPSYYHTVPYWREQLSHDTRPSKANQPSP